MSDLIDLIDRLPLPEIPASLSRADQELIRLLIESARQQVRPYTGNYQAPWLLVPFENDVWYTTNRGREELIDGAWKNAATVDWRVCLPNGCLLSDARYQILKTALKKASFLMRSGLICGSSAPNTWVRKTNQLIILARWAVLREGLLQPEMHGLGLIDQASLEWFMGEYAQGNYALVLQIPQRALAALYFGAHGTSCPTTLLEKPYALPLSVIAPIVRWIKSQGGYKKIDKGQQSEKAMLRRPWLGRLIHEDIGVFSSSRISRFLRQFETDFAGVPLLVPTRQLTEFPSQKVALVGDETEGTSESSLKQVTSLFSSVLDAHRHLPAFFPDPAGLSLRRAQSLAQRFTRTDSHTPFMPINIGLAYLNVAVRFVHLYGDALVGLYLDVVSSTQGIAKGLANAQNAALTLLANKWRIASGESVTTVLNINQFNGAQGRPAKTDFNRYRSNPTLDEAICLLTASCVVCMAILKPSREEELTHLKRNCLRQDGNGYWFNLLLGKSNVKGVEAWQDLDRPIPVIAAKSIQLLQRLGMGLCDIFGGTTKQVDNLFYLPRMDGLGALKADSKLINSYLDGFCDFVGLPPDSEGRRWYVRIHEMRKWFLLLLFWSGRFDVLDAARWIAGHTDAAHIYAYIEKGFPGESLPQIEAQYSEDRLRRLAQGLSGAEDGADALYDAVLKHFNVESLVMIPDAEWTGYVRALREADQFHLEPHSIRDQDGIVVGINVSFVMREA